MIKIISSNAFDKWLNNLKNKEALKRIKTRLMRIEIGNFGDRKSLGGGLYEIRINYGVGFRIYYTQIGKQVYLLLLGGGKDTQAKDIESARELKNIAELGEYNGTGL